MWVISELLILSTSAATHTSYTCITTKTFEYLGLQVKRTTTCFQFPCGVHMHVKNTSLKALLHNNTSSGLTDQALGNISYLVFKTNSSWLHAHTLCLNWQQQRGTMRLSRAEKHAYFCTAASAKRVKVEIFHAWENISKCARLHHVQHFNLNFLPEEDLKVQLEFCTGQKKKWETCFSRTFQESDAIAPLPCTGFFSFS